nr:beta-1,3-glucan-binding protein-like [Maniola hyperantus]
MIVSKAVFCLVLLQMINGQNVESNIPNVIATAKLRALHPTGFRAYIHISGDVQTKGVIFNGVLIGRKNRTKSLWGSAIKQARGGWIFEDPHLALKVGNTISYHILIADGISRSIKEKDRNSYTLYGFVFSYQVSVLEDPLAPETDCTPTRTKVRGRYVCAGELIFEDNFDKFREDLWRIEQYIPVDHPDHPFVSYQRLTSDPNVFVANGTLHIVPKLQENLLKGEESILSGHLDLKILLEPLLTKLGDKFLGKFSMPEILKIALADGNRVKEEDLESQLHVTLGVAAGGAAEFPDNSIGNNGKPKPWHNGDPKASLRFWEERHSWLPTWTQPSLIVDYIKVVALES